MRLKPNKLERILIIQLSLFVILIQLFELFFVSNGTSDILSLNSVPIVLAIFCGGPAVALPVTAVWTIASFFTTFEFYLPAVFLILESRIVMVLVMWWAYHFFKFTKYSNEKTVFFSILTGVVSKRIYLSLFYHLSGLYPFLSLTQELMIVVFQSVFYTICIFLFINRVDGYLIKRTK